MPWILSHDTASGRTHAGAVSAPPRSPGECPDYIAYVQSQTGPRRHEIERARLLLLALLPDLLSAAEICNAVAVPSRNTTPSARKQLREADEIIHRARDLMAKANLS